MEARRTVRGGAVPMSIGLGAMSLSFGLLKLVDPFKAWYAVQVSASGLPALSYPVGIATEVLTGLLFLVPWIWRSRLATRLAILWSAASLLMIGTMLVAVYVHLSPNVPSDVLPLKIKPPIIPAAVLVAALGDLLLLRRFVGRKPLAEPSGP